MMDGNVNTASMGEMNDQAGLEALVADLGSGNVIDAELLEGCSVEGHELDEMGPEEAAQVAAQHGEQRQQLRPIDVLDWARQRRLQHAHAAPVARVVPPRPFGQHRRRAAGNG